MTIEAAVIFLKALAGLRLKLYTKKWQKSIFDSDKYNQFPGGGATQSGKGYQLRSDLLGAVAVASQDGYKKGGCPVNISSKRGAVIVLIANIVDHKTVIVVLIMHRDSQKYTLVG